MFLELFEAEINDITKRPLKVEYLLQDSSILLPPTGTPMTGIEFTKRLPCGEVERARRAIRVFLLMRRLTLAINGQEETQLPLVRAQHCIKVSDVLDLNNSDLIACTVTIRDGTKARRFLVIDPVQLILVEPDSKRLGWGVATFVGFLQDIEVAGDKDDSRCLQIIVHNSLKASSFMSSGSPSHHRQPLLAARFVFDDHIRCMAAKQRLTKGRIKARQRKMHLIACLLDAVQSPCASPSLNSAIHPFRPDSGLRNVSVFQSPNVMRPLGLRRAPGLAMTGRLPDASARPRLPSRTNSQSSMPRRSSSKESIPLMSLIPMSTATADSSKTNDEDQVSTELD